MDELRIREIVCEEMERIAPARTILLTVPIDSPEAIPVVETLLQTITEHDKLMSKSGKSP